jgi:hypothetical protein
MNNILYVTSFNQKIYKHSGKHLIQSFADKGIEGDLYIGYEEDIADFLKPHQTYNIDNDQILKEWIEANKEIIPIRYGGTYPACGKPACRDSKDIWKGHNPKCLNGGYNSRTSRWFRKLITLKEIVNSNYKYVVWIDSDCQFIKQLTFNDINAICKGFACSYHWGVYRPKRELPIETGLVIFDMRSGGQNVIIDWFELYTKGTFKEYPLWSDSHMLEVAIKNYGNTQDLMQLPGSKGHRSRVVEFGPFQKYIKHDKGTNHKAGAL